MLRGSNRSRLLCAIVVLFIVAGGVGLYYWRTLNKAPIKVGVSTTLTGRASTWGVRSRNGIMLAVERVNDGGGINGRMIEVVIKDDRADSREAVRVDRELIDEGVVAVLGHYISTVAVDTVSLFNEKKVVLIGLATTTPQLTGLDDYLIRVMTPDDRRIPEMAVHAYRDLGLRKVAVVYDLSNAKYTVPAYKLFRSQFEKEGGTLVTAVEFDSRKRFAVPEIVEQVIESKADSLVVFTNGIHGAMICQHLKRKRASIQIFVTAWAFTDPDFIKNGGLAIEGVRCVTVFNAESKSPAFLAFKKEYESRFGDNVNEACQNGYEAAMLLFDTLRQSSSREKVKETILKLRVFNGLNGDIVIDAFGDAIRPVYVLEIRGGQIRTLKRVDRDAH